MKVFKSKHIFVYNPIEYINILNIIKNSNQVKEFFFIRYWENGPHLRIRYIGIFPIEVEQYVKKLKKIPFNKDIFLNSQFDGKETKINVKKMVIHEQNAIVNIAYKREYDRYGGINQIELCEKNFINSSYFVIKLLNKNISRTLIFIIWFNLIFNIIDNRLAKQYCKYWTKIYTFSNDTLYKNKKIVELSKSRIALKNHKIVKNWLEWKLLEEEFLYWKKNNSRILFSLLHMSANRLGISIEEENTIYKILGDNHV